MSEKFTALSSNHYKETCLGCGLCCTQVFTVIENRSAFPDGSNMHVLIDEFPYSQKEDGYCEMYERGRCKVYNNRPLLCDSRKSLSVIDPNNTIDRRKYYEFQRQICRDRSKSSRKGKED
jgi:hypothetical protein